MALTPVNPKLIKSDEPMETANLLVLNGQSWKGGQFLYADANSALTVCATNADASTGGIKYVALVDQADPANATTYVDVGVITQDMVFEGNELDGTATATDIGGQYALDVTSNICTLDLGDTSDDAFEIVDIGHLRNPAEYAATDVKNKVWFKVIPACIEAAKV